MNDDYSLKCQYFHAGRLFRRKNHFLKDDFGALEDFVQVILQRNLCYQETN